MWDAVLAKHKEVRDRMASANAGEDPEQLWDAATTETLTQVLVGLYGAIRGKRTVTVRGMADLALEEAERRCVDAEVQRGRTS